MKNAVTSNGWLADFNNAIYDGINGTASGVLNAPMGSYEYGTVVFIHQHADNPDSGVQLYFPDGNDSSGNYYMYSRSKWDGTWRGWRRFHGVGW